MRYLLDSMYGLRAVHAAGLIHGDFKTLNMLVGPDQRVKVGDFGLSKCLGALSVLPGTKTITGTPQYMAPEVCHRFWHTLHFSLHTGMIYQYGEVLSALLCV